MDNHPIKIAVGLVGVALIFTGVIFYVYKKQDNNILPPKTFTSDKEAMLQKQLLQIAKDGNETACGTITDKNYRPACVQFFNPGQDGRSNGTRLIPAQDENLSAIDLKTLIMQFQETPKITVIQTSPQ